jgi:hypothetical protein
MEIKAHRPGSITFLLVGIVLLLLVAGLFLGFSRFDCPECDHGQRVLAVRGGPFSYVHDLETCERCNGKGFISIWNKVLGKQHYPGVYKRPPEPNQYKVAPIVIPQSGSNPPGQVK